MNTAFLALEQELGAPPPRAVGELAPDALQDLADAIRAAHQRQSHELAAAGDAAFNFVPRLLRGPVRKLLG